MADAYAGLVTGVLLVVFGPIAVKILERLMGNAPTWVWRFLAFLCVMAGWAIVLLNEPAKTQVGLHPKTFIGVTVAIVAVSFLLVRGRLFDTPADFTLRDPQSEATIDVAFDPNGEGFVQPFTGPALNGQEIVNWKLYRVALCSPTPNPGTRLHAMSVKLKGGDFYPSLPLRIMGDPDATEFKLHAKIPWLWDVVEKPQGSDWFRLTHTALKTVPPFIVQAPYSFKITASSDRGAQISRLVVIEVDPSNNNELMFRLEDINEAPALSAPIPHSKNDATNEIRPFFDMLTAEEKRVLRFILPLGRSPTNLNAGQVTALESVQQKTAFVGRNYTTGSYEMNPQTIEALKILLPLDAGLYGKIICHDVALTLNAKDKFYDCFVILQLRVANDSVPTMVSRWQLDLYWQDVEYPSVRQSVYGYFVKVPLSHAGDTEMGFEQRALNEFPNDEEITDANYKIGFVRFKIGTLPVDAVGEFQRLHKDVALKLQAFDSKDRPHLIYEGSREGLSGCGQIQRPRKELEYVEDLHGGGLTIVSRDVFDDD